MSQIVDGRKDIQLSRLTPAVSRLVEVEPDSIAMQIDHVSRAAAVHSSRTRAVAAAKVREDRRKVIQVGIAVGIGVAEAGDLADGKQDVRAAGRDPRGIAGVCEHVIRHA